MYIPTKHIPVINLIRNQPKKLTCKECNSIEIEAKSKAEAERLFNTGEAFERDPEIVEQGMENVKLDVVEEVK